MHIGMAVVMRLRIFARVVNVVNVAHACACTMLHRRCGSRLTFCRKCADRIQHFRRRHESIRSVPAKRIAFRRERLGKRKIRKIRKIVFWRLSV